MSSGSKRVEYEFGGSESYLECDLSHIHPSLDVLTQRFELNNERYEHLGDRNYYESVFRLFLQGSTSSGNARHLPPEQRSMIWEEVFHLKNLFLEHKNPDVVIHRVKHPFPFDRRYTLYKEKLNLENHDIYPTGGEFIWLERKLIPSIM
ncbi:MAG: hypothetical protein ACRYG7_07795 [Janthinobacterium lividum]